MIQCNLSVSKKHNNSCHISLSVCQSALSYFPVAMAITGFETYLFSFDSSTYAFALWHNCKEQKISSYMCKQIGDHIFERNNGH